MTYRFAEIRFKDHSHGQGMSYLVSSVVRTIIVEETEDALVCCWWECDGDPLDERSELVTIAKSTVEEIRSLDYAKFLELADLEYTSGEKIHLL